VHNGQSATVGYRYDPLGNRIRTILPDGRHIDYLYYGSGHLHQISLDGEVITDIERDKLHREIQRTQGSISSLYDYDPMGRLKSQRTVWSGTQTPRGKQNPLAGGAVNRRYAYDKAGNLIQSADQRSGVLNYVYDKIGRIQEARNSQTGRSETFAFDPAHNILDIPTSTPSPVGEGKTTAPISDDPQTQGRLKSPAKPNLTSGNRLKEYNGIEYTYDALGNLIYRQLPNGENQYYQYDLENQLVRAEIKKPIGNTEIWTYAYDPFGRRLSKERQDKLAWTSTEPKRTHFVWDGTRLLQEYTYKGSYTYIYTDQDSYEPLAQVFHNNQDGGQYLAYFHNDQIGIPKEMTDIHGNLLWYGEYTAWGRLKKDERVYKNAHQPFRLQNQYFDEETGLHYNLMRYYEPEAGRFVNQDPIGLLGGDNLYQFAPNTLMWIDLWGLSAHGGGSYGNVRKASSGGEVNHMPAYKAVKDGGMSGGISRYKSPATWMSKADHQKTASWGRWATAIEWRSQQAKLIDKGKFGKAMEMDIRDIKRKFGKKYNKGIREMIDYAIDEQHITRAEGRRLKRKYTKC
ncbi:RHS repeat-associated core domain-containing protein, partial [Neisseria sicca]|uniref:RHS repeat-associated core domain-containing protein n=1 Tax=Neisseria sicca TaxID=490 RepID=UPI0021BF0D47